MTDWALLCCCADEECPHGDGCKYHKASEEILEGNKHNWDRRRLAAALRNIIIAGPSKENRVPFLVGATNTGKSTLVESFDDLYGFHNVFHLPAITDEKYALSNWLKEKRFVFWDEFSPVEFAGAGVFSVTTFKAAFGGKYFEVQRAQNWHDGNTDWRWQRGVVFTNKAKGLWTPTQKVSLEDVRHMQSRVELFPFTFEVVSPTGPRVSIPQCRMHLAQWIRDGAAAFDAAQVAQLWPHLRNWRADNAADGAAAVTDDAAAVQDLSQLLDAARVSPATRAALVRDIVAVGAVHVQELTQEDWQSLTSWQLLKPLEQRRVLTHVPPGGFQCCLSVLRRARLLQL